MDPRTGGRFAQEAGPRGGMSRGPARFTQADIVRAIRAIQQTGANMEIVIELDGSIRIVPHQPGEKSDIAAYKGEIRL